MAQKKFPESWGEFLVMYNKLDSEKQKKLDSVLYEFLVAEGKIKSNPEIEDLRNQLKEEERIAKEHEKRADELQKELERLKGKNPRNAGRKQKDFVRFKALYETHHKMSEIMNETGISRRTYFRYKKLYDEERRQIEE